MLFFSSSLHVFFNNSWLGALLSFYLWFNLFALVFPWHSTRCFSSTPCSGAGTGCYFMIHPPQPLASHLFSFPWVGESQGQPDANDVFEAEVWLGRGGCFAWWAEDEKGLGCASFIKSPSVLQGKLRTEQWCTSDQLPAVIVTVIKAKTGTSS